MQIITDLLEAYRPKFVRKERRLDTADKMLGFVRGERSRHRSSSCSFSPHDEEEEEGGEEGMAAEEEKGKLQDYGFERDVYAEVLQVLGYMDPEYKDARDSSKVYLAFEEDDTVLRMRRHKNGVETVHVASVAKFITTATANGLDVTLVYMLLANYPASTLPRELLEVLIRRYCIPAPLNVTPAELHASRESRKLTRVAVLTIMSIWLERYPEDFARDPVLSSWMKRFSKAVIAGSLSAPEAEIARGNLRECQRCVGEITSSAPLSTPSSSSSSSSLCALASVSSSSSSYPAPRSPSMRSSRRGRRLHAIRELTSHNVCTARFDLMIKPEVLAEQMCLRHFALYQCISPRELLKTAWTKKDRNARSPHIVAMTRDFNALVYYVQETICSQGDIRKRAQMLSRWLRIGRSCFQLQNYHGAAAVYAGLNSSAVVRMKKTQKLLGGGMVEQTMQMLSKITSRTGNFKAYKELLEDAFSSCVPYLPTFLSYLEKIEEGHESRLLGGINWSKHQKRGDIIDAVLRFQDQEMVYKRLKINRSVQKLLAEVNEKMDFIIREKRAKEDFERKMYEYSRRHEPPPPRRASSSNSTVARSLASVSKKTSPLMFAGNLIRDA